MLLSSIYKLCRVTDEIILGEPSCLIRTLREIIGKNAQTFDQKHCDLSEFPDIHSLDIVIFGPYTLISDEELI
jgi:hypothetical protein